MTKPLIPVTLPYPLPTATSSLTALYPQDRANMESPEETG